jgi:hypothetical protein
VIGTLAIAALTVAVADDHEPTPEERFRILRALGDLRASYEVLLATKTTAEITALLFDATWWVTRATNLDDLAARILEFHVLESIGHETLERHSEDWRLDKKPLLQFVGDTPEPEDAVNHELAKVPVFGPTPDGVRMNVRSFPGVDQVVSWDKDRILLILGDNGEWKSKFVPVKGAQFAGERLSWVPVVREPS